ncbi:TonB-dependent receptor [Hymenobacter sp.]|jgi:TonB-linked SusC/RagA family outer membrane protein|uniref:SusC/RagA family TonB-linked outer membrane protein n=1 Tax=Hymenobacter sp. TaxID=1898978 RepID=UPI002ED9DAC9
MPSTPTHPTHKSSLATLCLLAVSGVAHGQDFAGLAPSSADKGYDLVPAGAPVADVTIKGKVTDEKGEGLPGATVLLKGTTNGTTTDGTGGFSLTVPNATGTLIVSFIGYQNKEVAINNQSVINITLGADTKALEEVVVVGYGTQKKRDLTGTVVSLDNQEIVKSRAPNAQEALQGRLSGVDVKRASGKPGSDLTIEIRGANSIGGNTQPLYVVDGIPVTNINDINPADIERMDILKDASSTAIYGSRGANGVVIVTTKKGTSGGTRISYDGYVGFVQAYNQPNMMNGPEFANYAREFARTRAIDQGQNPDVVATDDKVFSPTELRNVQNGTYTDWIDMIQRTGLQTNHLLSISGGDGKTNTFLSAGYQNYQGAEKIVGIKKYTLKLGIDKTFNDRFKFGASAYASFVDNNPGTLETFRSAYRLRPTGSAYNDDGTNRFFTYETEAQITNPLFDYDNEVRRTQYIRVLPNVYGEWSILKNLRFRSSFTTDITYQRAGWYQDTFTKSRAGTAPSNANYSTYHVFNYDLQNFLTYTKEAGDHNVTVLAGTTANYYQNDGNSTTVVGLPYRSLWYNLGTATAVTVAGATTPPSTVATSNYSKQTTLSYLARANYSFRNRYLLTLTGRYDGNSILAQGKQWDFFPSAGLAWVASDEEFLKSVSFLDLLKARVSYGESGNAAISSNNPLGLNPYATQVTVTPSYYDFNGTTANGFSPSGLGNRNLTWEKTREYNVGFETSIFKGRLALEADYYNKTSKGSILVQQIPAGNGFNSVLSNVGSVRNRGIELNLNTVNVTTDRFSWKSNLNFARNHNEILDLYGNGKDDVGNAWFIGENVRVYYNYNIIGVWQTDEADQAKVYNQKPGQWKLEDRDNDGRITPADRKVLGSNSPKWFGGITNNLAFAGFDLNFTVYTRQGVKEFNQFIAQFVDGDQGRARYNAYQRDYWTPTNPSNEWANNAVEQDGNRRGASYIRDANYTKISNITLGYNVPKGLSKNFGIDGLRVYATAYNPFIFTDYIGWDPESASLDTYGNQSFRTRTFLFGVNVNL